MGAHELLTFALETAVTNTMLERLVLASVEATLFGAVVWIVTRYRLIRAPRVVAYCWFLVLAKSILSLAVGPIISFGDLGVLPPAASGQEERKPAALATLTNSGAAPQSQSDIDAGTAPLTTARENRPSLPPMDVGAISTFLWCGGVSIMLLVTFRGLGKTRRLVATPAPPIVQRVCNTTAQSIGLTAAPKVWVSDEADSPALCGYIRPRIVIPRWLLPDREDRLRWVLRHELTHLRHRDHIANAVRRAAQTLFFFHPIVWFAGRQWEEAAEFACDEALTRSPQEAKAYAKQLYELLLSMKRHRATALSAGLYASRTQVGRRIEALLRRERQTVPMNRARRTLGTLLTVSVLVFGIGSLAGSDAPLIGGTEDHRHTFRNQIEERSLTYTINIEAVGAIGFSANHESITSMSDDARMICRVTTLWQEFMFDVSPGAANSLELQYQVNGKTQDLNEPGREWLSRAYRRLARGEKP